MTRRKKWTNLDVSIWKVLHGKVQIFSAGDIALAVNCSLDEAYKSLNALTSAGRAVRWNYGAWIANAHKKAIITLLKNNLQKRQAELHKQKQSKKLSAMQKRV